MSGNWKKFPFFKQADEMSCGASCIRMIAKYYGKSVNLSELILSSGTTRDGANLYGLSVAAEKIGFRTVGAKVTFSKIEQEAPLPCILFWDQKHFIVLYKVTKNSMYVADPAHGLLIYSRAEFTKHWETNAKEEGIVLLLEPTPLFYEDIKKEGSEIRVLNFSFLLKYLRVHRASIIQLILGLLVSSLLQLIFPFLTQSIVDIGITNHDVHFIYLILIAQLMVFFGKMSVEIIRSYILMYVSSRVNISLVSDFFIKLMNLPMNYFDSKMTGDIMQRISDNRRIESFLTGASLSTLFSTVNFIVFSAVLAWYSYIIFYTFLFGTALYFFWIWHFLKKRADLDFQRFKQSSENQSKIIELINGMQEIKLHNAERQKRWQWETLQVKLFKINLKGLKLTTAQNT